MLDRFTRLVRWTGGTCDVEAERGGPSGEDRLELHTREMKRTGEVSASKTAGKGPSEIMQCEE